MKARRLIAGLSTAILALVLVAFTSTPANANANDDPAQNPTKCTAIGGTYLSSGATKTCTVSSTVTNTYERDAGKSGKGWVYVSTTTSTTVYTRTNNDSSAVSGSSGMTSCTNPGGQLVTEDFPKHCMP
jgi:hypothetical protein